MPPPASPWSDWVRGISHDPLDGWFTRNESEFASLPTKVGGVYEIAVGGEERDVVYCGRALATEAGGGTSLRSRLFSGYAKSGSHLHVKMRQELEKGRDVWFRWRILTTREEIARVEREMIETGRYSWNKISAPRAKKSVAALLEEMIGNDADKLKQARAWLEGKH